MTRDQWLNDRRYAPDGGYRITASDVAAITGWHPTRTAIDVYAAKVTGDEIIDTVEMMIGREFEEPIAKIYAKLTGREVHNPGSTRLLAHPDIPWLAATLDREIWEIGTSPDELPGAPLEIKHAGFQKLKEWSNGCPMWVQIQNQIQMACSNSSWGAYCGVVGGTAPKFGDLSFSSDFINSTIPDLEKFRKCCETKTVPEVQKPRDLDTIKDLFPNDNKKSVSLGHRHLEILTEWNGYKVEIKEYEEKRKKLEATIRADIGEATFGVLPDGSYVALKTIVRKDGVSYRTLNWVD
jgi:putative phage-type endonuclease